ncbi:MAG: hypothetical protein DRO07_02570 [Candidatus Iainarchaeum archaeon]|mgnify:CR=1 FL=1|uniref:Uncharacterized protein n=1 Tax=Candidatus Iainarchaeum sp. TaxID=3101447 RepID=A0A497JG04_9ARCH|nr:MAG: hypothetical protein DRO07_02570 [Candidatus Diapherotrites archaeon]
MPKPKRPKRHEPKGKFREIIKREISEAAREYPRIIAHKEAHYIEVKVTKKTTEALEKHLKQLPTEAAFQPAAFFREREKIVNYASRLFDTVYCKKVKNPQEKAAFLKEFQKHMIKERRKLRDALKKISKDKETLVKLKRKLSSVEFELNMAKLKKAEAKIRTYHAVAEALLRGAKERMRELK